MIEAVLWITGLTIGSGIGVTGWFFAYAHAKHLHESGVRFGPVVKVPLYIYLGFGVLFDVLFNVTVGSIVYREVPKEFLFTKRTRRHLKSENFRRAVAKRWALRLNKVDPGHV
jgi:hypothetical protein